MGTKSTPQALAKTRVYSASERALARKAEREKADAEYLAFQARPHLAKKEVLKIQTGTWIEVKWMGSPNTLALTLERMERYPGTVSIRCYHPDSRTVNSQVCSDQVVSVVGDLAVPTLPEKLKGTDAWPMVVHPLGYVYQKPKQ